MPAFVFDWPCNPSRPESQEMWERVVTLLCRHGVWEKVDFGLSLLQGAFGVVKTGKFLPDGRPVLQLVMDCLATDRVMVKLLSDLTSMPRRTALLKLVFLPKEDALFCAEDLVAAVYLLELPAGWRPYFTFRRPVDAGILGGQKRNRRTCALECFPWGSREPPPFCSIGTRDWRSADFRNRLRCSNPGLLPRRRFPKDKPFL